ncbi:pirin family protein [Isoptericola aurantiacus]|uniref:pirin family protein n=1 Tax=Isoptericola aurantiacus TaxID=3377839 RepID=UPI00383B595F
MSNLETRPSEQVCGAGSGTGVELLGSREVPLGGPRALTVRRTVPQRRRSLIGAWCFCDHYGPDDVAAAGGMQVPPHPHIGLQTVTWLFAGEILHRDSLGTSQRVRPGELNLMTAGHGISHSEESPADTAAHPRPPTLHGVQLWTVLPAAAKDARPEFEHHGELPTAVLDGARVRVLMGSLRVAGTRLASPARTFSPLVGAQLDLPPHTVLDLETDPGFEHGVLVDSGEATVAGTPVPPSDLAYVPAGRRGLRLTAGAAPVRALLIGGVPFDEDVVMWWNFVGRDHEEIVAARRAWTEQVAEQADGTTAYARGAAGRRFGQVEGYATGPLRAPELPDVRLRPRRRPGR